MVQLGLPLQAKECIFIWIVNINWGIGEAHYKRQPRIDSLPLKDKYNPDSLLTILNHTITSKVQMESQPGRLKQYYFKIHIHLEKRLFYLHISKETISQKVIITHKSIV